MDVCTSDGMISYCDQESPLIVVTDFHPLREFVEATNVIVKHDTAPNVVQIDAHNGECFGIFL